nr:MAG TPA: hypothetical protein [Caudoviricetes sp.]
MDKKVSLEFAVDGFEFEDVKDARFAKGIIHAFADGENAHTHPIETKVLIDCANSVYDIPLVCRYNGFTDDFMSHEADETPIGFIKETSPTYSNPIVFEKHTDGRTFLVIKALIWKKYAKDAVRVFKNSEGKKAVSVEITITKGEEIDGKVRVDEFVLDGITVLGDFVKPAVKDARIQVEFAQDKTDYLNGLKFADTTTEETGENMADENKMAQEGQVNCADDTNKPEDGENMSAVGTDGCACNGNMADDENAGSDNADGDENMAQLPPENMSDDNKSDDDDETDDKSDNGDKGENRDDESEEDEKPEDDKSEKMSVEAAMSQIATMSDKINELEAQNKAYMSQIEAMSDYEDLKQFKFATEQRIKQEADMATMNKVMSEIAARGCNMSDEEKDALKAKFSEFSSADAWSNYVKAQAFEKFENNSSVQQIGLPFAEPKKTNSIWDSI